MTTPARWVPPRHKPMYIAVRRALMELVRLRMVREEQAKRRAFVAAQEHGQPLPR